VHDTVEVVAVHNPVQGHLLLIKLNLVTILHRLPSLLH
jgi:hypothetical protein